MTFLAAAHSLSFVLCSTKTIGFFSNIPSFKFWQLTLLKTKLSCWDPGLLANHKQTSKSPDHSLWDMHRYLAALCISIGASVVSAIPTFEPDTQHAVSPINQNTPLPVSALRLIWDLDMSYSLKPQFQGHNLHRREDCTTATTVCCPSKTTFIICDAPGKCTGPVRPVAAGTECVNGAIGLAQAGAPPGPPPPSQVSAATVPPKVAASIPAATILAPDVTSTITAEVTVTSSTPDTISTLAPAAPLVTTSAAPPPAPIPIASAAPPSSLTAPSLAPPGVSWSHTSQ